MGLSLVSGIVVSKALLPSDTLVPLQNSTSAIPVNTAVGSWAFFFSKENRIVKLRKTSVLCLAHLIPPHFWQAVTFELTTLRHSLER